MRYAALDNMIVLCGERELIQLTDRAEPPSGQMDVALINRRLDTASTEIDAVLGVLYALPLVEIPSFLVDICCDIARYHLYPDPTDTVKSRYKAATERLASIGKGLMLIPGATGKSPAGRDDTVQFSGPDRRLTRDSLAGF